MRIIADKILLSSLLVGSLFLTGCSVLEEGVKENTDTAEIKINEANKESSSWFGSWFGDGGNAVDESVEEVSKDKKDVIKSSMAKKYPKLTKEQQEVIVKIKIDAEAERKKRIEAIKVGNINAKVVAKIAKQIRLEDTDNALKKDLDGLASQLKLKEENLETVMQSELDDKIKSLDLQTKEKISQIKSNTKDQRIEAISSVEKKISKTQSEVESALMKKALTTELDRFYLFKENERKLKGEYLEKLSLIKIELDKEREKQLTIMSHNVKAMQQSNQELLTVRVAGLERKRIAEALEIEKKAKAKNMAIIDQLIAKFNSEIDEYGKSTREKLVNQENSVLTKITSNFEEDKVVRLAKEKAYKVKLGDEIVNAKESAGQKMRQNLASERDTRIQRIDEDLEMMIRRVYADRKQSLSNLKKSSQDKHKQVKSDVQAEYEKNKRDLISQSKKGKLEIKAKARAKEREILAKERREIAAINKDISVKIKTDSDTALKTTD